MTIPFTQFLMPDGRQKEVSIDRPEAIGTLARGLIDHGCVFEIEMLSTGEISMEVMHGENSIAAEICLNGPEVPKAVDRLVEQAILNL